MRRGGQFFSIPKMLQNNNKKIDMYGVNVESAIGNATSGASIHGFLSVSNDS
jgi:hypothetical protein